jgi:hypothetical protein
MGCIGGNDDAKGSTPRAAENVITEINEPIRKKARVSVSGVSFIMCVTKKGLQVLSYRLPHTNDLVVLRRIDHA